jgi:hypothetical protein
LALSPNRSAVKPRWCVDQEYHIRPKTKRELIGLSLAFPATTARDIRPPGPKPVKSEFTWYCEFFGSVIALMFWTVSLFPFGAVQKYPLANSVRDFLGVGQN